MKMANETQAIVFKVALLKIVLAEADCCSRLNGCMSEMFLGVSVMKHLNREMHSEIPGNIRVPGKSAAPRSSWQIMLGSL